MSYVDSILERVKTQNPHEPEFNQAVYEVLESLRPVIEKNEEKFKRDALLKRLTTPVEDNKVRHFCGLVEMKIENRILRLMARNRKS